MSSYNRNRLACAFFFAFPGLVYGLFAGRLPALRVQIDATESELGMILFCFGIASFAALYFAAFLISRFGSAIIILAGCIGLGCFFCGAGFASTPVQLGVLWLFCGVAMSMADAALNAQCMEMENFHKKKCMTLMHAAYNLGAMAGAFSAGIFSSFYLAPGLNFACDIIPLLLSFPLFYPALLKLHSTKNQAGTKHKKFWAPPFAIVCGICALLAYVAEGSVADWGSIYLHSTLGASQPTAALLYAFYSACVIACRLKGDALRTRFGDQRAAFLGATLACLGLCLALCANSVTLCFVGYGIMAAGLSPVAPIMFSLAGSYPGLSAATASAMVSIPAYAGLFFFPPFIGFAAENVGLRNALLIVLAGCAALLFFIHLLKKLDPTPERKSMTQESP